MRRGAETNIGSGPENGGRSSIVLAQCREMADPETGGAYTVRRYASEKVPNGKGGWRQSKIMLMPIIPDYQPIVR